MRNPAPRATLAAPRALTPSPLARYTRRMPQTFLIFDFGADEEAAQKARHRIEGWKQGFRLDRKMLVRFEREAAEPAKPAEAASNTGGKPAPKSEKHAESAAETSHGPGARVRLLVRLDFSEHEKLSRQRWLDRIPGEEPFSAAKPEIVASGDANFDATATRFEALEAQPGPPRAR
jgi:hypothetical protein